MSSQTNAPSLLDKFQNLASEDREALAQIATPLTVARGTLLYRPAETNDVVFFLRQGIVQFYRMTPEEQKLVIFTLNDDGMFGETSLWEPFAHNTFAEAFTDCALSVVKRDALHRVMQERPQLAMQMLGMAGRHLRMAEMQIESLAFKSIPVRLAERLLLLANEQDEVVGLTHQDLAEMIGTYRETTTQTLNDMKAAGLIAIGRRRLTILDKAGLQAFARQTP